MQQKLILVIVMFLQKCVRGALKGKTVLLVTHQVDFLHNVDCILVYKSLIDLC